MSASLRVRAAKNPALGALVALVVICVVDVLLAPDILGTGMLFNLLLQSSTTILVAMGMTIVIATGAIDLSVGSVMAVVSAVAAMVLPYGVPATILAGFAVAVLVGLANGILVARFRVLPIIVTLAMLIIGRGAGQVIVSGSPLVTFSDPAFERLGKGMLGPIPVPVLLAATAVGVLAFVMRATTFGRYVVAVGGNERAAELAGVPVARVKVTAFVLSAGLAALAGLIVAARLGAADPGTIGLGAELDGITASVVGGTALAGGRASIVGTVIGSLLIAVLNATFAIHLLPHAWGLVAKAVILLVAVSSQRARAD